MKFIKESPFYRIPNMCNMPKHISLNIEKWWDDSIKEYSEEEKRAKYLDGLINNDSIFEGTIKDLMAAYDTVHKL